MARRFEIGGPRPTPAGTPREPARVAVLHTNLVLLQTADAAQLDAVLERAELRNRVVARVGPDRLLVPRGALPALRKRLTDLAVPFRHAGLGPEGDA